MLLKTLLTFSFTLVSALPATLDCEIKTSEDGSFTYVNFGAKFIEDQGMAAAGKACAESGPIDRLYLNSNRLTDASAPVIARMLQESRVKELDLMGNFVGDATFTAIAKTLESENSALESLALAGNRRDNQDTFHGAEAIAKALETGKSNLSRLDLDATHLVDGELESLARALRSGQTKLVDLNVARNCFTDKGALALAEAIKVSGKENFKLAVSAHGLKEETVKALEDAVSSVGGTIHFSNDKMPFGCRQ